MDGRLADSGALDGIEAIRRMKSFVADQVKRVTVRLAPSVAKVVDNRDIPDICLQHMIAVMLLDKTFPSMPRMTSRACRTRQRCASAGK